VADPGVTNPTMASIQFGYRLWPPPTKNKYETLET